MNNSFIKYPSWWSTGWKPENVTTEQVQKWKEETELLDKQNRESIAIANQKYIDLKKIAQEVYGLNSLEFKYILKNKPYYNIPYDFNRSVVDKIKEYKEKIVKESQEKEQANARNQLINDAIIYLQLRNKKFGIDFDIVNAIETANDISYNETVTQRKAELILSGEFVAFSGDNCEDCMGWDGDSHRCNCGNRRVCWSTGYKHSFKTPYVYAEAY